MIPNNLWSTDNQIKPYATYGKTVPPHVNTPLRMISLGPQGDLSKPWNKDASDWWQFEYVAGDVVIYMYNGTEWEYHSILLSIAACKKISGTFDQNGRPLVFFDTGTELRLWWYDPVLGSTTTTVFGVGTYPFATFDIKYGVDTEYSDVLLFYMRDGGIYYRMQRDRYSVEYATPVTTDAVFIKEADMAVDYRLQLLYRYIDTGYTPSTPVPPVVDPASGIFAYLLTGYQSAVEVFEPDIISATMPFSIAFQLDNVASLNAKSTLFSYGNLKQMPKVALAFSGAERDNIELSFFGYYFTRKIFFGLQSGHWLIEFYPLSGIGPIDSMRLSCKPTGSDTYHVYSMEGVIKPTSTAKGQVLRIGSRPSYGERVYKIPGDIGSGFVPDSEYAFGLRGVISNIELHTAIAGAPVIKLPMVKTQNAAQALLDAASLPLPLPAARINDYKAANWQFIAL